MWKYIKRLIWNVTPKFSVRSSGAIFDLLNKFGYLQFSRLVGIRNENMASTKASTAVSRSFQIVKPHLPSIKFRGQLKDSITTVSDSSSLASTTTLTTAQTKLKGPSVEFWEIPERFKPKPISQEEMEYIERGGPD